MATCHIVSSDSKEAPFDDSIVYTRTTEAVQNANEFGASISIDVYIGTVAFVVPAEFAGKV